MKVLETDFSGLEGTNCYCSPESAELIRGQLENVPLDAIHFIGTGDYHYVSLFYLERIREPFGLLLFDNHPDDQPTAFGGDLLSCGSWVAQARELPFFKGSVWTDGNGKQNGDIPEGLPVYLSVDIDILSKEYASTDWSQGAISLSELKTGIQKVLRGRRLIGADICGGLSESKGALPGDRALNERTVNALCDYISRLSLGEA